MQSLKKISDGTISPKLSEHQLKSYTLSMAEGRRRIAAYFNHTLRMPVDPCFDVLLELKISNGNPESVENLSANIYRTVSTTRRYLHLMATAGLIEFDGQDACLTSKGAQELSYMTGQVYAVYVELMK